MLARPTPIVSLVAVLTGSVGCHSTAPTNEAAHLHSMPSAQVLAPPLREDSSAHVGPAAVGPSTHVVALDAGPMPAEDPPTSGAASQDQAAELAKKLSNPIAALISVPIQVNWDTGIGPEDADRTTINVQPVIPLSLSDEWNLITRTIVPIIDAESPISGGSDESGLGDVLESLFFSPKAPTSSGWIWGAGPVFLLPTASDDALGGEKWGIGPTVVVLKQERGWTYGALANHIWSVAGDEDRDDVNATFLQPFLAYATRTHTTFTLNTESTYDWEDSQWTVPINAQVSQILKVGDLPISVGLGYREYLEAPDGGPDGGLRFILTFLFPK